IGLVVERTMINGNFGGGVVLACTSPCTGVDANLVGNTISGNVPIGISLGTDTPNLVLTLDRNFVFFNAIAVGSGSPTVRTLGNNTFANISVNTPLTPLAAK